MKINDIRISAIGGTICSIWASFSLGDVLQTILTAALGTLVSFLTSRMIGRWNNRRRK
jgi:mannitol-specific phosphotransferase system IIBC component